MPCRMQIAGGPAAPRLALAAVVALVVVGVFAPAQQDGAGPAAEPSLRGARHTRFWVVISGGMFTTVNRNDALAAMRIGLDLLARLQGYHPDIRVDVVDGTEKIRQRLADRVVDVLLVESGTYFRLESTGLLVADFVGNRGVAGSPRYTYQLLVSPHSKAKVIRDLRGKNLLYYSRNESRTAYAWIEVELAKEKLDHTATFFSTYQEVTKPQACVLPLFFGSADACVVDEISFGELKDANPQLATIRTLARSAPLVDAVIATPRAPHPFRSQLLEIAPRLHETARGQKILSVFKLGRLVRAAPADLEAARTLWKEFGKLSGIPEKD